MTDQGVCFSSYDDNEGQHYLASLLFIRVWSIGRVSPEFFIQTEIHWLNTHKADMFTLSVGIAGTIGHGDLWTHSDHQVCLSLKFTSVS